MRWKLWRRWLRIAALSAAPACSIVDEMPTGWRNCSKVSGELGGMPTVWRCEFLDLNTCFVTSAGVSCTKREPAPTVTGNGVGIFRGGARGELVVEPPKEERRRVPCEVTL